jgi:anaerobic magnesium-protoporphyrin IX monomethyl ester cyclase
MKVFLCIPPSKSEFGSHLGLAYLASALEGAGHQVFFADGNLVSTAGLIKGIQENKPGLIGICMNTVIRFEVIDLVEILKTRFKIPVVVGGPHPTLMADQLLKNYPTFDYALRGEAEKSLVKLVKALESRQSLGKVTGLSFRRGREVIHNRACSFEKDLDKIAFPKHSMYDYRRYPVPKEAEEKGLKVAPMIGSRGCPFNCNFCSSSKIVGHSYRARSAANMIEEVIALNTGLGATYIYFWDDHFFLSRKRTKEFCEMMIKRGLSEKIGWRCTGRVDCVDGSTLKLMKKAGCEFIAFGVESGTEDGLEFYNKRFTLSQIRKAFALAREAGLKRRAAIIVGGDHETKATIEKQRQFIEQIDPDILGVSVLTVFPETALFYLAKKKGMVDESIWLERNPKIPFHNNAPLYPGPHLDHDTLIKEAAKLTYWWNTMVKKNRSFSFSWGARTFYDYLRARKFKELANILFALAKQWSTRWRKS